MPIVYNKENAAKALDISVETLDRLRKSGKLPYHQIRGRIVFTEDDINAFLDACKVPATVIPTDRNKKEMAKAGRRGGKTLRKTVKVEDKQGSPIYDYGVATLELSSQK